MAKVPAFISHTVLIHAGSYKDFTVKLTTKYPKLAIKFVKKIAIHYFIVQLEDHNDKAISNKEIYNNLPIMALREEFSGFIFFKSTKAYNNVLFKSSICFIKSFDKIRQCCFGDTLQKLNLIFKGVP